jgi:hypothetical protein
VTAVGAGVAVFQISVWGSMVVVVMLLSVFVFCLKRHLGGMERQQHKKWLETINRQELRCMEGDSSAFPAGDAYCNLRHDYTSDLDVFGEHSLFRYLNRTTSPSGSDMLAAWLSAAAATDEIKERQRAVTELSAMLDLRQDMQAIGLRHQGISGELPGFLEWLRGVSILQDNRVLRGITDVLPWVTIAMGVAATMGWIPSVVAWLSVAVNFFVYGKLLNRVNRLHQQVSRKVNFISTYSDLIELVSDVKFSSPLLVGVCHRLNKSGAQGQIRALERRIRKLDYRLNMAYIPLNILFFFDFKHLLWLDRWRINTGSQVEGWFDAMAQIEVLSCFANVLHNHPCWAMPDIKEEYFTLEAQNIGHPLIKDKERVGNDFSLTGSGKITVVTGSNMSGKSTFERSIGVNMVLAMAGAPVCADALTVTNCRLYSYMRIADSLEDHTSSFYAELKRLQQLIEITKKGERVFFLLDEVLRGTNSRDRQIGSMALVRQLSAQQVSGIIATHDLTLGNLTQELPDSINNAHFDVQINGGDMSFDYKLYQGVCTSLNASLLMKKIGIDI